MLNTQTVTFDWWCHVFRVIKACRADQAAAGQVALKACNVVQKLSVLRSIIFDVARDTSLRRVCGIWNHTCRGGFQARILLLKSFPCYLQDADTDENQGSLGFEEFCSFYKMISTRRDLYLIMISYSNQKEVMDLHDLARFLENEQKVRTRLWKGIFGWNISRKGRKKRIQKRERRWKNFLLFSFVCNDLLAPSSFLFNQLKPSWLETQYATSQECVGPRTPPRVCTHVSLGDYCISNHLILTLNAAALEK